MKQRGQLVIFMDGECTICRVTSRVIDATDRGGAAEVVSFRDDSRYRDHGVSDAEATAQLQVIDTGSGNIYAGFAAVRAIAREIPLLLPVRVVLWLLAVLGIGEPVYNFVAKHRPRSGGRGATGVTP